MKRSAQQFRYEFVSADLFLSLFKEHRNKLFADTCTINSRQFYSETEKSKIEKLREEFRPPVGFYLLVYDNEKIIGWSFGEQKDIDDFYMVNSAVYPEYRRNGIYSTMLNMMITKATEAGFQQIYSRHHPSNNAVIIPKLKAGFIITSMEISDIFGTLVRLTYYTNKNREAVFRYRVGESRQLPHGQKENQRND